MELFRALAIFAEPPCRETERIAELFDFGATPTKSQYTELFLFQLYPYASVYLGEEGMLGGDARDRVAGFWRVIGEPPPPEPDHLAVMLSLYARLFELEVGEQGGARRAACRRMRATLLWDHLLSWLPVYLQKLRDIASPAYTAWERLLTNALLSEAQSVQPHGRQPVHFRSAPPLLRVADDPDAAIAATLAPIRSGMIVTHADLRRAAAELGVGLRRGERRFVLKAMLEQDFPGVTDWLRREAVAWCDAYRRYPPALGGIAPFWASRASHTAANVGRGTLYGAVLPDVPAASPGN